jgi:hypothetical protein
LKRKGEGSEAGICLGAMPINVFLLGSQQRGRTQGKEKQATRRLRIVFQV